MRARKLLYQSCKMNRQFWQIDNFSHRIFFIIILILFICPVLGSDELPWYMGKTIVDFKFLGLKNISISELKPIVKDYIGKDFSLEIFYEIQDRLWELEFFNDIRGEALPGDEEKNTVIIEFHIKEKPVVSEIKIVGYKHVSKSDILDDIITKRGDFENYVRIKEDEVSIKNLYIEKGFNSIEVSSRVEPDESGEGIIVYFDIVEGFKTTIKDIYFSGNEYASESTLRGELESKKQDIFNNGIFQESNLEIDKERIRTYYHTKGYINIKVEKVEMEVTDDTEQNRRYLNLIFYVNEGDQFTFGGVIFNGNKIFQTDKLLSYITQKKDKVFNKVKWDFDFQKIITHYADSGYINNSISSEEEIDSINKVISYTVNIVERDRAHIENIIFTGNTKTKDYVLYRELPFEVGDIFSAEKIRQGMYNLYNLQYFSDIRPQPVQGSSPGLMDLIINVEETSWADFKMGIAFSGTEFPVSGQVGWSDKNFFGTGRTIGVDLEVSPIKQGLSFNFQDNYFFGKGWGGGISLSFYHSVFSNIKQDIIPPIFAEEEIPDPYTSEEETRVGNMPSILMEYDSIDLELALNTGVYTRTFLGKFGYSTELSTSTSYVYYDSTKYRPYEKTIRENLDEWDFINRWGNTLYWDTRDIYYNPESGFLLSQYIGFCGGFLFGERDYIKLKTKAESFFTLFKIPVIEGFDFQTVLALHSAFSIMLPQLGYGNFVLHTTTKESLYYDGMNVARGWPPAYGGDMLMDFSLELRHPIVKQFLWWTWFFDAAGMWENLWDNESWVGTKIEPQDFKFSFGAGLRLTIPGFPIRFYLSQKFFIDEDGAIEFGDGEIPITEDIGLRFVIAITQPGGF